MHEQNRLTTRKDPNGHADQALLTRAKSPRGSGQQQAMPLEPPNGLRDRITVGADAQPLASASMPIALTLGVTGDAVIDAPSLPFGNAFRTIASTASPLKKTTTKEQTKMTRTNPLMNSIVVTAARVMPGGFSVSALPMAADPVDVEPLVAGHTRLA